MVGPEGSLESWSARRIVANTFPLLVVLSVVVLAAGITLENAEALLAEYAVLAIMVPTMVATGGNLGAILSSRLTTRFHLGTAALDPHDPRLRADVVAVLALAATIFTALAVGAYLLGAVVGGHVGLGTLLLISLTSGMAVTLVAIGFSFAATYASYVLGVDPDDATVPIVTNVVDVVGMLVFVGVSSLVLGG